MYKLTKIEQVQHIKLLFIILILCSVIIFLVPILIGAVNKYFQLIPPHMATGISYLGIILGLLGYLVAIFTLFTVIRGCNP